MTFSPRGYVRNQHSSGWRPQAQRGDGLTRNGDRPAICAAPSPRPSALRLPPSCNLRPRSVYQNWQRVYPLLSPPRKRGSRKVTARMDSRLRGNDVSSSRVPWLRLRSHAHAPPVIQIRENSCAVCHVERSDPLLLSCRATSVRSAAARRGGVETSGRESDVASSPGRPLGRKNSWPGRRTLAQTPDTARSRPDLSTAAFGLRSR
jgi:hypothetical protein